MANQKSPTCLLLTPDLRFHSFGFAARDFYHDLDPEEARHWLYFDKFKMKIHSTSVRGIRRTRGEDNFTSRIKGHFCTCHFSSDEKQKSSSKKCIL